MLLATRLRSRWVTLTLVALVASLLAVSAAPVAGRDGEADELAEYSACVGPALDPAGFRDVSRYSSAIEDAINCLAHYRITLGTAAGGFFPDNDVTRWQMALFLIRAAGPAGIDVPRPSDQGFTDIEDMTGATRDAINQLAALGITKGTTRSTFSPHRVVNRRQMAQFLARFLDVAPVGEGGVDIDDVRPDDEHFRDIRRLPRDPYEAVLALFEMGVTTGTSATLFSPNEPVTRAQMARFITRALAHTNARPAGITLQTADTTVYAESDIEVVVSVRDRFHRPVVDASVDLFYIPVDEDAFQNSGRCDDDEVIPASGDDPCEIDRDDETTDVDGNLIYDLFVDEDLILWGWTGDLRDRFDVDDTDYVSEEFSAVDPAVAFRVTDDMPPNALRVPYGRDVTFTFQLVDEYGEPVAEEDVDIEIRYMEDYDNRVIRHRTRTYSTDSSGRVRLPFEIDRPRSSDDGVDGYLEIEVRDRSGFDVLDETTVMILTLNNQLVWTDEDDEPTTLLLEQTISYSKATDVGSGGRNSVTATLVDQFGDPERREIHFLSGDSNGLYRDTTDTNLAQPKNRKTTGRRGTYTLRYHRKHALPGTEQIWAFVEDEDIRTPEPPDEDTLVHYWVEDAPDDRALFRYDVLVHDEDRDTLVIGVSGDGPYVVTYDSEDRFNFDGGAERFRSFTENLDVGDQVDIDLQGHDRDDINTFTRYEV